MDVHKLSEVPVGSTIVINYPNLREYNELEMLALHRRLLNDSEKSFEIYCPTCNSLSLNSTKDYMLGFVKFFISKGVLDPSNISIRSTEEINKSIKYTMGQIRLELENGFKEYKDLAARANELSNILPKGISIEKFSQE